MYRYPTQHGMTFIEMLVAIAILVLAVVALSGAMMYFYRTNSYTMEQTIAISDARRGVDQAVSDIREAAFAENGDYPVVSAAEDSFTFYSDVNEDDKVEKVRLFLDGTDFKEGVTGPSGNPPSYSGSESVTVLSADVRNTAESVAVFMYYDSTGNKITNLTNVNDIRFVEMTLVVNVNPSRLPQSFFLESSATLRNVR